MHLALQFQFKTTDLHNYIIFVLSICLDKLSSLTAHQFVYQFLLYIFPIAFNCPSRLQETFQREKRSLQSQLWQIKNKNQQLSLRVSPCLLLLCSYTSKKDTRHQFREASPKLMCRIHLQEPKLDVIIPLQRNKNFIHLTQLAFICIRQLSLQTLLILLAKFALPTTGALLHCFRCRHVKVN